MNPLNDLLYYAVVKDSISVPILQKVQILSSKYHPSFVVIIAPNLKFTNMLVQRKIIEPHWTHECHMSGLKVGNLGKNLDGL